MQISSRRRRARLREISKVPFRSFDRKQLPKAWSRPAPAKSLLLPRNDISAREICGFPPGGSCRGESRRLLDPSNADRSCLLGSWLMQSFCLHRSDALRQLHYVRTSQAYEESYSECCKLLWVTIYVIKFFESFFLKINVVSSSKSLLIIIIILFRDKIYCNFLLLTHICCNHLKVVYNTKHHSESNM